MIAEINAVMSDVPLIADELKIIAGERNGLNGKDRQSLLNGAVLIDEAMRQLVRAHSTIEEQHAELAAVRERLREALGVRAFPPLSACVVITTRQN